MENAGVSPNAIKIQRLRGIKATDLVLMDFPEPKWAVPGILPEGLNILGGKPKKGKSILAHNICLAVASGGKALGKIQVAEGTVIYFALEDTYRRLKDRTEIMLQGREPPEKLILYTELPRMDRGGLSFLERECAGFPDLRLVVIDTFAKFRPASVMGKGKNPYDIDYQQIGEIKHIADKRQLSILLIHHLTKMEAEDPMDTFSGTLGLTGAADGLLALIAEPGQGCSYATLHVTGRDLEANVYRLNFEPSSMSWTLAGEAQEIRSTLHQQKLYDVIRLSSCPLSPNEITEKTGLSYQYVKNTLPKLLGEGCIRKQDRGQYEWIDTNI